MRISEHRLTIEALDLLGIPIADLEALEQAKIDPTPEGIAEAEKNLEAFKERVRSEFKRAVRTTMHPDRGGSSENFMTIRKFSEWVKGWRIRIPRPQSARDQLTAAFMQALEQQARIMAQMMRTATTATTTSTSWEPVTIRLTWNGRPTFYRNKP